MKPTHHLPGLDTLRAVAILLVIMRHAWEILRYPWLKPFFGNCGWAGVDLFFLLSGFLIGSQLIRSVHATGGVDFKRFYFKRSFRILPAFLVTLALYQWWPDFREATSMQSTWRFLTFTMNFEPGKSAFSHAWSLCVEEHFYLVFPLLVALPWRKIRFSPLAVVPFVVAAGMILRYVLWSDGAVFSGAIYRPTYCRLDGLMFGATLAFIRERSPAAWEKFMRRPWLLFVGGLLAVAAGLWLYLPLQTPGLGAAVFTFPLISLGFGLLVASALAPQFWLANAHIPGASFVAALAYTLYLTHKQMIHLATLSVKSPIEGPFATLAVSAFYIVAAACILRFGVEEPALTLRDRLLGDSITSGKSGGRRPGSGHRS